MAYVAMVALAALSALNYTVFVFPNSFAPSGIDGICTMFQHLLHMNMGYLSALVNLPMLIAGWFLLKRDFVVKSGIYILAFSASVIAFEYVVPARFLYRTDTGTSIVLAPVAAGVIRGLLYVLTLKLGGSSGGVDIIAAFVRRVKPHYDLMSVIFCLNVGVAGVSYFVYGFTIEPVICSILYAFITSAVGKTVQATQKESVKFEIITPNAHALCAAIEETLKQTATVVDAQGAHSGSAQKMVICVTEKRKAPLLEKLLRDFPEAVTFESIISNSVYSRSNGA